jgi:hypothetical protein
MSIQRNSRAHEFLTSPRMSFDSQEGTTNNPPESSIPSPDSSDDWGYFVDCEPVLYAEPTPFTAKTALGGTIIPEAPQEGTILEL